jgi:hypothetical protein
VEDEIMLGPAVVAMSIGVSGAITPLVDRSGFSGVSHTLIDFETRGDGVTPIFLFPDSGVIIPNDEYAPNGVLFADSSVGIIRFSENTFSWDAFLAQSSPNNAFTGVSHSESIIFINEIHSVGFEVVFSNLGFSQPPRLQAFDDFDNPLGEIVFDDTFIDGILGFSVEVAYGFMGLSSTTPIAKITFNNMFDAVIDDLYFSAAVIPAPGVLTLALPFSLAGIRRRQRASPPRANTIPPTTLVKH